MITWSVNTYFHLIAINNFFHLLQLHTNPTSYTSDRIHYALITPLNKGDEIHIILYNIDNSHRWKMVYIMSTLRAYCPKPLGH